MFREFGESRDLAFAETVYETTDTMNKLILTAREATLTGSLMILSEPVTWAVHYWNNTKDVISWRCEVPTPGSYRVELNYSLASTMKGGIFSIGIGKDILIASALPTFGWGDFKTFSPGLLIIREKGVIEIEIRAICLPDQPGASMPDIAWISLTPVKEPSF